MKPSVTGARQEKKKATRREMIMPEGPMATERERPKERDPSLLCVGGGLWAELKSCWMMGLSR
jgi:hypothetical protein